MYTYTHVYIYMAPAPCRLPSQAEAAAVAARRRPRGPSRAPFGWHYSSNATCLIRPRLFFVLFLVVSRIAIIY